MNNLSGKWAMVTGASAGLGEQFALQLAEMGASLVLVARRKERLDTLAADLRQRYKVNVVVVAQDLADVNAVENLVAATEGSGNPIFVLINNAGFGTHGSFLDQPWNQTSGQIQVNITALTELTHRFGTAMSQRKEGFILNVSSVAAYAPVPGYATYAATKSYVLNFTEAVSHELAQHGVTLSCLCPGGTATEFMDVAGHKLQDWQKKFLMSSKECVQIGLDGLFAGSRTIVSGWMNKIVAQTTRFLPRRTLTASSAKVMGGM